MDAGFEKFQIFQDFFLRGGFQHDMPEAVGSQPEGWRYFAMRVIDHRLDYIQPIAIHIDAIQRPSDAEVMSRFPQGFLDSNRARGFDPKLSSRR